MTRVAQDYAEREMTARERRVWDNLRMQAFRLTDDAELARHAAVSTDNRHQCFSCFTCACEAERKSRQAYRGGH